MTRASVVVVGAGIAGLAAAVTLAEAGVAVTVLEASDRVGGRIRTVDANGIPVELGAEFVHGKPPELLALLQDLGLHATERSGEMLYHSPDGSLATDDGRALLATPAEPSAAHTSNDAADPLKTMETLCRWVEANPHSLMSFATWCIRQGFSPDIVQTASGYVEGFNAADAEEISVRSLAMQQAAEDSIQGDTALHVDNGYGCLPHAMAERLTRAGGVLRMRSQVTRIEWRPESVTAVLAEGDRIEASASVLTLPLGTLQSGSVTFDPAPGDVLAQSTRMRTGHVCRITLVFKRRWWADLHPTAEALQQLSFLIPTGRRGSPQHAAFDVFWTGFPSLHPVLTAWSGGPSAQAFHSLNDHAVAHIACADLARIFGLPREAVLNDLVSHHHHDWTSDPLSLGAYSWVPVGAVDVSAKLAEPVQNTLFFAGEHTDTSGHWGTVHGALRSGLRAAAQILA